ncbi:MAG: hypothetical protein COB37_07370 [Kordiimonadales bacterium]|nr:MAG: hypothetical protein COB37_07370 [Kordiimonadales bacterium]
MNKAKILGIIGTILGTKILFDAWSGHPANGAALFSSLFGGADVAGTAYSVILGTVGLGFGLRALIWNKVCIGDTCEIDGNPQA